MSGKLILPGDPGFRSGVRYPWHNWRRAFGLKENLETDSQIEIHGFFVRDDRVNPPIAIFKNCKFQLAAGNRPNIDETPVPFSSIGEALGYIKSLNLSIAETDKLKVAALAPDPGAFHPRPNVIFPTKDELKK